VSAIRLYLIPFYGAYNIDGIKPSVVSEFHAYKSCFFLLFSFFLQISSKKKCTPL